MQVIDLWGAAEETARDASRAFPHRVNGAGAGAGAPAAAAGDTVGLG